MDGWRRRVCGSLGGSEGGKKGLPCRRPRTQDGAKQRVGDRR